MATLSSLAALLHVFYRPKNKKPLSCWQRAGWTGHLQCSKDKVPALWMYVFMWQAFETDLCIPTVTLGISHSIREASLLYNFIHWLSTWYFLGKGALILEVILKVLKTSNRQRSVLQAQPSLHGEGLCITWPLPAFPASTTTLHAASQHSWGSKKHHMHQVSMPLLVLFCPFTRECSPPFGVQFVSVLLWRPYYLLLFWLCNRVMDWVA